MAIKNTIDRKIPPTHPGEIIREDFMQDYNLTAKTLSEALGVSRQTINELIREKKIPQSSYGIETVPSVQKLSAVLA